jgi:hypothetical protein
VFSTSQFTYLVSYVRDVFARWELMRVRGLRHDDGKPRGANDGKQYTVWLYYRFSLSYRDVEELMAARGIVVTYETIRQWCRKFGQHYAKGLRRRRAQTGDKWHLDEVFLTINGKLHYLWRAVDQHGNVLDILSPEPTEQTGSQEVLSETAQGMPVRPTRADHR